MPMMLYKIDDDYEIWSIVGSHDHDVPFFGITKNYDYDDCYTYIRLDKPEYYNDYHPHLPREVITKLAKAMSEVIEIKDYDFYLKGTLWSVLVWLWNYGPESYYPRNEECKILNKKQNMPDYIKLTRYESEN